MTARVSSGGRTRAGQILNVSEGGFLLSPIEGLSLAVGQTVVIETAQLGSLPAQLVSISHHGLHLRISGMTDAHRQSVRRLAGMIRPWVDATGFSALSKA